MEKKEIILVYLGLSSLFYRLSWSTSGISWKKEIIPYESQQKKRNRKHFSNRFYLDTIMTKFIDMQFRYDKKSKNKDHEQCVDSKAEPKHSRKITK